MLERNKKTGRRTCEKKIYLKQKLTRVLFVPELAVDKEEVISKFWGEVDDTSCGELLNLSRRVLCTNVKNLGFILLNVIKNDLSPTLF